MPVARKPSKLILAVIDGLEPAMLELATRQGRAPVLAELMARGSYVDGCVAAFPSVTPVCAATIATGSFQDRHLIPSMNWYHRGERRYVEYGSSFSAALRFGIARQLTDTVYNMNGAHLAPNSLTVFERLDDRGVRTAGTAYLIYRGRHRHQPVRDSALTRLAAPIIRHPVDGPRELFYGDVFASRRTPCRSQLGMPGVRDRHAGCVSAFMVERDLFDFLLLSLPDNDWYSHKYGPDAQPDSIELADRELARVAQAAGGLDALLEEHAVIVVADHGHTLVERTIDLVRELQDFVVLLPNAMRPMEAEIAVCPAQRSAQLYILVPEGRGALLDRLVELAGEVEGVDLVLWLDRDAEQPRAVIESSRGTLRFAPGGDLCDQRGGRWHVEGEPAALDGAVDGGFFNSGSYPDGLARAWAALSCSTSGDVLLSAAPGYEFLDWGGRAHVGGGSHGSLHRSDSLAALVYCGVSPPGGQAPRQWSIADVAPMAVGHFDQTGEGAQS